MGDERQIPDTVDEMLAGMGKIDTTALEAMGRNIGAIYNGALAETGDPQVAVMLAGSWITAAVQNPNTNSEE